MTDTTLIPEIERAAATILARTRAIHPVIAAWVGRIVADPGYAETLDDFWPAADTAMPERLVDGDAVPQQPVRGRYGRDTWCALVYDRKLFRPAADDEPETARIGRVAISDADAAIYSLASHVVTFRGDGRPAGDQQHALGYGLTLTTSLAAAVAEFAYAYADAWRQASAKWEVDVMPDAPGYTIDSAPYAGDPRLAERSHDQ